MKMQMRHLDHIGSGRLPLKAPQNAQDPMRTAVHSSFRTEAKGTTGRSALPNGSRWQKIDVIVEALGGCDAS